MIAVIDASAGFELLTASGQGGAIRTILQELELVLAPDLFVSEIANVCWKAVMRKELSKTEATQGLRTVLSIVDSIKPVQSLVVEALQEAVTSSHSVYDLTYLVLARREGASLLSVDKGMKKLAKKMGVQLLDIRGM